MEVLGARSVYIADAQELCIGESVLLQHGVPNSPRNKRSTRFPTVSWDTISSLRSAANRRLW
jgi:hypothetical protein